MLTVINENPPLKTITKQKKNGLKTEEKHILDSKFENSKIPIFENKNRKLSPNIP